MDRILAFSYPVTFPDNQFWITGSSDATKTIKFEVDAQTTGDDLTINSGAQTDDRTVSFPVLTSNATLAVLEESQTFTGAKTFSAVTTISNTTGSTTYQNGALVVAGGAGVAKDLIGNQAFICSGSAGAAPNFAHIRFEQNSNIGYLTAADAATNVMPLALRASVVKVTNGTTTATSSTTGWQVIGDGSTAATNTGIGGGNIFTGGMVAAGASTTSLASMRLPHGSAPSSPVNGDMWTTTAGLFVRINGVTVGPLS